MGQTQTSTDKKMSPECGSVHQKRSDPEPSCVSMKSDESMVQPLKFKQPDLNSAFQKRSDPEPSCVSMKSNESMVQPLKFNSGDKQPDLKSIHSAGPIITEPYKSESQPQVFNDNIDPGFSHESEVLKTFRSNLSKRYQCLCEGISKQGNPTLLNEIYTELYITQSESGEISNEHEVRQIDIQSRRPTTEETPIKCNDIFKPLPEQHKHIRSVMTKGVAGIGKTVSVQKFILDWSEEKENQDVHLVFPLPFREINLMKDKTLSLLDLLHLFFPETKEMEIFSDEYKVLFIFDGLDECRLSLDFHSSVRLCDVNESTSVDVMLTNLIKGNLFPSSLIWITSRPAAADLIPSECVDRVTEIRGFSDPQKEEYFRKRISDESLSDQIISHLKSSRSLYIMCHIPVFCWISVTVLERILSEAERREIPKTLTQMYTHFLIIQTNIKHQKDYEKKVKDEEMIFKLGKLAFEQLVKGNLIFYDEDLRECGIDVSEASVYSGLCTQIFREEFGLYQGKVYSFVHLSIQEHLAALYVHLNFINNSINALDQISKPTDSIRREQLTLSGLHQRAVDLALESKNGHLDLFLRFLLGLSLESNQNLLHHLQTRSLSFKKEETVVYIQMRIWSDPSPEKSINLFHCLNELGDHSLTEVIQQYLASGKIRVNLSPSQWSALIFVLLTSEQNMNEFNMKKFISLLPTVAIFLKLLPVVRECRSVELSSCNITDEGCVALTSALRSNPSHLRDLNLSGNNLGDSGVKLISDVLKNPDCKLEILKLSSCFITDRGCVALCSALTSNPSHLTHLDLTKNNLGDSGVKLLSDVLKNPQCKLKILKLSRCKLTAEGCAALSSALTSNPSHLRELSLSYNYYLRDSGVKLICDVLKNYDCKLKILELRLCNITVEGCVALSSALTSNPSHLRDLDLSHNNLGHADMKSKLSWFNMTAKGYVALTSALRSKPPHLDMDMAYNILGDSGVKLISFVLKNPDCKLEILKLSDCNITDEDCVALSSALKSNPSHLRELNLSYNNLTGSGVKLLSDLKDNPHYKLETLE
ncbi:protein NLRC3-like [Misgurnus anguillicaudatus]|uniref:protein NLRC3-like n=1 Tax=Misgurnus anguillicaudatus TaxID=75329 RepID=UPI003CCF6B0E